MALTSSGLRLASSVLLGEDSMAGFAETVTALSVSLVERTIGFVARAIVRVDDLNVGLSRRNALQAVTANRAWRTEWEET